MGLQKLILHSFKSYSGETEINFGTNPFSAIIGPNGSGKSNLLDAMCFVIGMDITPLRGNNIKELVHKGSEPEKMSVRMVVLSDKGDRFDFKRTATEFFFNNKRVDDVEYRLQWAKINVFPDARNCVVLQGDIENLAGAEAPDLASLIENMQATSAQLDLAKTKEEYEKLESEIAKASLETRKRVNTRRAALAKSDEAMEVAQARERLDELRTELKKIEKRRRKLILLEKRAMLAEIQRKNAEAQAEVEACRTEAELVDADSRKVRADYARKRRQLLNARNSEIEAQEAYTTAETEFAPLLKKQEAIETEIRLLEPDLEYAKQVLKATEAEVENSEKVLDMLDRQHNREKSHDNTNSNLKPKLRDLWMKLENEFMVETALEQDKLDDLRRKVDVADRKFRAKQTKVDDIRGELDTVNSRIKQREIRVQQLKSLVDERTAQQQQRREELEDVSNELSTLRSERKEITAKLSELNERLRTTDGNKRALAQRHRLLDAVERLKRSHPGKVHDLLGNIVEPIEIKFTGAVERALGGNADSIVVDDAETAVECIAQARQERLGLLNFLPLSDLRNKDIMAARAQLARKSTINGPGDNQEEEVRLMLDCAKFEPRFRPALIYAMGDSVFVSEFGVGMKLRKSGLKMRIIDSHGSTISTNNIVSTSPGETSASTASDRTLAAMQRKAQTLTEKLKLGVTRSTELSDREIRLNAQIDRSKQMVEGAETELRIAKEYLLTAESEASNLRNVLADETKRLEGLQEDVQASQNELDIHLKQINEVRVVKFSKFLAEAGGSLADWDSQFSRGTQQYAEFSRQRQRLEDRLQLAIERRDAASTQLSGYQQRAQTLNQALQTVITRKSKVETELNAASHRVERAQARVRALRDETENKSNEVGSAESAVEAAHLRVAEAEREEHRHALALAAEIGEDQASIDADAASDSEEDYGADREKETSARKRKRSARTPKNSDRETLSIDRLDSKIKELKTEMEPLIKLASLASSDEDEHASKTVEQCNSLDQTAEEARSQLDEMVTKFNKMKETRATRFNESLTKLQNTVSATYAELVGSDAQAKLTPINSDTPFEAVEFSVMPPGKPFTSISQLSGGERSMAALALLFSCQRLHPAPFVVLDEVDAALDFINVASVSKYIRTHIAETQFIIISLKQRLFQSASHLVGIYKEKIKSQVLLVPLQ